jgi:hypothetical protein
MEATESNYEAIRDGVRFAFLEILTVGNYVGLDYPQSRGEMQDAITAGVREAFACPELRVELSDESVERLARALRDALRDDPSGRPGVALLDRAATCARYGQTPRQLEHLVRTGQIPFVRIGRRIMFDPNALDEWVKSGGSRQ